MPFARISLLAGKPASYLAALGDSLQSALVESFEVPPADRFQAFHQHAPGELVFGRNYLGGPRSDDFVLIHIITGRERSLAVKQRFYRTLVRRLAESPGVRPEDVLVVVSNSTFEDWSFSSGICAATPDEAAV